MMMMMIKKKKPTSHILYDLQNLLMASKFKFPNYLVDPKYI